MLRSIRAAITVLHQGERLTDAATWKNRQNLVNILIAVIGAITVFLPESINLSGDDIATVAGAIGVFAGIANSYITTATTNKIGLPPPRIDPYDPGP